MAKDKKLIHPDLSENPSSVTYHFGNLLNQYGKVKKLFTKEEVLKDIHAILNDTSVNISAETKTKYISEISKLSLKPNSQYSLIKWIGDKFLSGTNNKVIK